MTGIVISALPAIPSSQLTDIGPFTQSLVTYKASLAQIATLFNASLQLASPSQVTGLPAQLASFLPLAGGVMTGVIDMGNNKIINLATPTNAKDAVNKAYADVVGSGLTVILATQAATTANLNATAAGAGIGATLTNAGAQVAFAVDGYSANLNDRILVKNQTLTQHNGVYAVTTVGTGATNWVLTRVTDYDTAAQIKPGTLIAVNNGTVNATTSWIETATVVTVDTDPVLFSQFTFAPGAFFQIANNLSEGVPATMRANLGLSGAATMTLPVSLTNGGTNTALTASNGGMVWSNATQLQILAGTATAGLALLSGATAPPTWSVNPPMTKLAVQTFLNSGTYTPATGLVFAIVRMVGGGGGSGSCTGVALGNGATGGGGSGGYLEALLTKAQIGASQAVTIGLPGIAGTGGGANGGQGGTTSLGTLLSCTGGAGSNFGAASTSIQSQSIGGGGGSATVATGVSIVTIAGQVGTTGLNLGQVYFGVPGVGGSNPLGLGGVNGASGGAGVGVSGTGFGAGASGAVGESVGENGAAGTQGYIEITEFISI
jgi:hypothetical protein